MYYLLIKIFFYDLRKMLCTEKIKLISLMCRWKVNAFKTKYVKPVACIVYVARILLKNTYYFHVLRYVLISVFF